MSALWFFYADKAAGIIGRNCEVVEENTVVFKPDFLCEACNMPLSFEQIPLDILNALHRGDKQAAVQLWMKKSGQGFYASQRDIEDFIVQNQLRFAEQSLSKMGYYAIKQRLFVFCLCSGVGLFLALAYFGVMPDSMRRHSCRAIFCDPHHWQILTFGLGFMAVGITCLIPSSYPKLGRLAGWITVIIFVVALLGTLFFARR